MNRQRLILAMLLCLLVLAVGYSVIRFPRQKQSDTPPATGARTSGANRKSAAGQEERLRLDLLQKNQAGFTGFKKNIFAPIFREISKLPPVKPVIPAPPPPPPPPVVAAPSVSPQEQELAQFTFLGFLDQNRKKTIFLAKNKEIFLVKKGERVAGRYEATAITDDALTLRVAGGDTTEIVIPLIENQALKAAPPQQGERARRPERNVPRLPTPLPAPAAPPAGE